MKQLPLPAHPVFPSRLDSLAALPELLRSRQIGCVLVIGDAHAVDCESLLLPVLEDRQIMYAVHAAVSLSDSKDGALTRTDVDTALQAFTDKQAQAILAVGGNDAMALGQALLARLHTKGYAETFEQWRAIPLILLPAAADASAVFAETGDVFDPVRGKSRRFSLRAHTSRYVLMDDAMLALQSRESLLRTGIWTIAHAICAGMSRLLPREERQKAENALRSLTGQLIAVSDDAAVPESERFSSDLASRRALHTASLDAAEAFAVSHDAVLPALLNALSTVKQLSPDETLPLLLAPMIAQSEGARRKALSDMAIGAGLCAADADGAAALAAWVRDLVFHAGYGLTLPTLYHRDIPAVARIAAQDTLLNRFALEDILRAIDAEERVYFRLLTEHHDDCTLFFCRSDGSSIETVLHKLMDQKAEQTVEFFSHIYGKAPNADAIRLLMGSQFWYFRQLLDQHMEEDRMLTCLQAVLDFTNAGWRQLCDTLQ